MNTHGGHTGDLLQDAIDVSRALVARRVIAAYGLSAEDGEDAMQDFTTYALSLLDRYDPERAKLSTFLWILFDQWNKIRQRKYMEQVNHETLFDPLPGRNAQGELGDAPLEVAINYGHTPTDYTHELSPRALELLDMLAPKMREAATYHLAYGATLEQTAEHMGITARSVSKHIARAREIWAERLALAS